MASRSAIALARSAILRRGSTNPPTPALRSGKRNFASSGHDDAYETAKWEKITYVAIVSSTLLAAYNLSKGHPHYDEQPAYPYLHIRNKEFPWGPDGLFEVKHSDH